MPPDPQRTAIVPTSRIPALFPALALESPPLAHFDMYMDGYLGKDSIPTLKSPEYLLRVGSSSMRTERYIATAIGSRRKSNFGIP